MSLDPMTLQLVRSLWPDARPSRRPGSGPALLVLPRPSQPRMLVPTGVPAAAAMLRRHSTSRTQTVVQDLLGWGVRSGVLGRLPVERLVLDGAGIADVVRELVPAAASVGVLLGPPRANAKPVLQVFAADGTTIAFVKVGHDQAAARLVAHEAAVLGDPALAQLSGVSVPERIGLTAWSGSPVLVLSALSGAQTRAGSWELPVEAMVEVAGSAPVTWSTVGDSPYWAALSERVSGEATPRTAAVLGRLAASVAEIRLGFGRWHGDWAPWNSAMVDGRLQLWDWEQSTAPAPLGLDAVHFVTQKAFRNGWSARELLAAVGTQAGPVLRTWYADGEQERATTALYLAEITLRYERQAAARTTAQLSHRLQVLDEVAVHLAEGVGTAPEQIR